MCFNEASMRIFTSQRIMGKILPQKKKKDTHEDIDMARYCWYGLTFSLLRSSDKYCTH